MSALIHSAPSCSATTSPVQRLAIMHFRLLKSNLSCLNIQFCLTTIHTPPHYKLMHHTNDSALAYPYRSMPSHQHRGCADQGSDKRYYGSVHLLYNHMCWNYWSGFSPVVFNETRKMTTNFRAISAVLSHRADCVGGYLHRSLNETVTLGRIKGGYVLEETDAFALFFSTWGSILIYVEWVLQEFALSL